MLKPTAVQERALLTAINSGTRSASASLYALRTLSIMEREGWIELVGNGEFRVLPAGARSLGRYTQADTYEREDALASDPVAKSTQATIERAHTLGIEVDTTRANDMVMVSAETLAMLLDSYSRSA